MPVAPAFAADAAAFLGDLGVPVVNGASSTTGLFSVRDVIDESTGAVVKRQVLRLQTGTGGTITEDTILTIDGADYRVDRIQAADDGLFTDYVVAGSA